MGGNSDMKFCPLTLAGARGWSKPPLGTLSICWLLASLVATQQVGLGVIKKTNLLMAPGEKVEADLSYINKKIDKGYVPWIEDS